MMMTAEVPTCGFLSPLAYASAKVMRSACILLVSSWRMSWTFTPRAAMRLPGAVRAPPFARMSPLWPFQAQCSIRIVGAPRLGVAEGVVAVIGVTTAGGATGVGAATSGRSIFGGSVERCAAGFGIQPRSMPALIPKYTPTSPISTKSSLLSHPNRFIVQVPFCWAPVLGAELLLSEEPHEVVLVLRDRCGSERLVCQLLRRPVLGE